MNTNTQRTEANLIGDFRDVVANGLFDITDTPNENGEYELMAGDALLEMYGKEV